MKFFDARTRILGLSTPAVLAAASYAAIACVVLLPVDLGPLDPALADEDKRRYSLARRAWVLMLMALPIALSVYSINCLVVGDCVTWSWIQSVALALWTALFVALSAIAWGKRV